jgi:hypothetical protein
MTDPTPPRGSEPEHTGREETAAFAAPLPPQQPGYAETAAPAEPVAVAPAPRRGRVLMGAAAAGLLAVGVVVGVIVGQATAGSAAADTGTSTTVPDGSTGQYGTPPDDGRFPGGMGGHGGFDPDGDDGTTDGATTDGGTTSGDATT